MDSLEAVRRLWGKQIRYLIGANNAGGAFDELVIAPYMKGVGGTAIRGGYCNLLDELNKGKYGPYLEQGDTAAEWNEGQIDPLGDGWRRNLNDQLIMRGAQGIEYVEWDNPDSYPWGVVRGAYNLAQAKGFHVLVKNPDECENPRAMVLHPAAAGIIVEADCGDVPDMDELRTVRLMHDGVALPVWFVTDKDHEDWARYMARSITKRNLKGMGVTMSTLSGEDQYNDSVDILRPRS